MFDLLLHRAGLHFPLDWEPNPTFMFVTALVAFVLATTVHEFGHAFMADLLGDPTPRSQKRLSLSPLAHFDVIGLFLLVATSLLGLPFGWGKPVRTNPEAYTRCSAKVGMGIVAVAGPAMNMLCAALLAPVARWVLYGGIGGGETALYVLLGLAILMLVNLSLFCFNLVPVSPLDAALVVASLLPDPFSKAFRTLMGQFGPYLLLLLMYSGVLADLLGPLILKIFLWLLGIRF